MFASSSLLRPGGRLAGLTALPFSLLSLTGGWLCCLATVATSGTVAAADPGSFATADSKPSASQYVTQALEAEAAGDLVARDQLLTLAAKTDDQCAAAQWQRGLLKSSDNRWQSVDQYLAADSAQANLAAYEARRLISLDNAADQWQLTLWCLQNGYRDQARAHARRTVELERNHVAARRFLGFRYIAGEWISAAEWNAFEQRANDVRRGLEKYGKPLTEIARGFRTRNAEVRTQAYDQLMAISEPIAIAPVEAILGLANSESANASLKWLAKIPDAEASRSLVRFAMFHPDAQTRELATSQLKDRPYHDYVPDLLQMLSSPVASLSLPVVDRSGTLRGFRQAFAQERQGQTDVFVLDTRINYTGGAPQNNTTSTSEQSLPLDLMTQLEAVGRANERASENSASLRADNDRIMARNRRIAQVMSEVTDREFTGAPNELWKWWDEVNETEYQSLKLSSVRYASTEMATRNYLQTAAAAVGQTTVGAECFARGTQVITRSGSRPIETVRVGDLVLSRDILTGELSWRPVIRTTVRPPRPVFEIKIDDESMRCTGGHLFWVSGKGWTKASQLQPGDILHGAASPAVVMKIEQRRDETTYNLAVEATQTYFVGKQMVLSHDVTDRVPTYIKVPGLTSVSAH